MKFYHAENCNRRIATKDFTFAFEPYDYLAGTWRGILATDDPAHQTALESLVADPRSAVTALSAQEYAAKAKKKHRDAVVNYSPLLVERVKSPLVQGKPVEVAAERPSPDLPQAEVKAAPLSKAQDALKIGEVSTSPAPVPAGAAVKKDSKK